MASLGEPTSASFGQGAIKVVVLASAEPASLSGGAANAAELAAGMAGGDLINVPITLEVRSPEDGVDFTRIGRDLAGIGARLVLTSASFADSAALAGALSARGGVVISTGATSADASRRVYSAAPDYASEAQFIVENAIERGHRRLAVVATQEADSRIFASLLAIAAVRSGATIETLDGATAGVAAERVRTLAAAGQAPQAIIFATAPSVATSMMPGLRSASGAVVPEAIGNVGWSFSPPNRSQLGQGWFPTYSGARFEAFARLHREATGQSPSVQGAILYDLIVLAAAVPQVVRDDDPYRQDVLSNPQGFSGQTGTFKFDGTGRVQRSMEIRDLR